jgi:hypothetical protein
MKNKAQNKNEALLQELKEANERIEEIRGRFKETQERLKSLRTK